MTTGSSSRRKFRCHGTCSELQTVTLQHRTNMPEMKSMMPVTKAGCCLFCFAVLVGTIGCDKGPALAPVKGTVIYEGQPLEFGSVMFQPENGWPARGKIQSDGTFELYTRKPGDGARIGPNKVRVACFEAQGPNFASAAAEETLGRLLIPERYTDFDTSGITVNVKPSGNDSVEIVLTD